MIINTTKGALAVAARPGNDANAFRALASDTLAGQTVTPESALALSAVYGAVSLIANACGTMPLEVIDEGATGPRRVVKSGSLAPMLRHRPNEDMSGAALWTLVYAHLLLRGNAYLAKIRNSAGQVVELYPIHPENVSPYRRQPDGRKTFRVRLYEGSAFQDVDYDKSDILHIMGPSFDHGLMGASPIAVMRNTYGRHLAQAEYQARFYQDGMSIQGAIVTPERLNGEAVSRIKQQWKQDHAGAENMWGISVLHSGSQFVPVSLTPEDAQFIETMRWGHTEAATAYSLPASRLNGEGSSLTYANQGQDDVFLYKQALKPRTAMVEAALNMDEDLFGFTSRWVPRFNKADFLMTDEKTRFEAYNIATGGVAWMDAEEVRESEGLPARKKITGGVGDDSLD